MIKKEIQVPILSTGYILKGIRQDNELWKLSVIDPNKNKEKEIPDATSTVVLKLLSSLYLDHQIELNKSKVTIAQMAKNIKNIIKQI